jgi:hypothetical protein
MGQGVLHAARGDWSGAAFMGLFGLVFGVVGFGGIVAAVKARQAGAEADAKRALHPEAPWMWRPDWATGTIEDSNRSTMVAAWIFAGFWNLISLPAAFFGVRQALGDESYGALFVLIFPAVGLGLLVWAIRATLRFRRYRVSRLELSTIPAPIGRSLRGTVVATGALDARENLRVTLTCVRRVTTGAGKTFLLALWLAAIGAMVHFGAPLLLQVIFGVVALLLLWATVASWLGVSRVTVGDGAVTVASGFLIPGRKRRIPAGEIAEVTTKIGMQAGNTPYYDLVLVRKDEKQVCAGRGVRDKPEAEWLATAVREALRD